jgi:hypothetical protein
VNADDLAPQISTGAQNWLWLTFDDVELSSSRFCGDAGFQKYYASAAVHLAFEEFQAIDLALGLTIPPRLVQGSSDGSLILSQAKAKADIMLTSAVSSHGSS